MNYHEQKEDKKNKLRSSKQLAQIGGIQMNFKDHKPFESQRLEEERASDKRKIMTVSMSLEEYAALQEDMKTLMQPKDSTALKQLWKIGRNVLHDKKTGMAIRTVLGNVEKNARVGITMYEPEKVANVTQKFDEK